MREIIKRIPEKVNQDGLRKGNCYRCGAEVEERKMKIISNRRIQNGVERGDVLMICKECNNG